MSLHSLANHLQSAGRGEDKVLVHMTPGEVSGLQSLAMAHGGSLTINPQTGLPEAGFLRSLLPMVAGFALGPAGFGLFKTAMGAGLAVGAATGLATGSLKQGLMAGLGAYGGAGLGQGLMAQGAQSASTAGAAGAGGPLGTAISPTTASPQLFNTAGASTSAYTAPITHNVGANLGATTPGMTSTTLSQARLPQYAAVDFTKGIGAAPPPVVTPSAVVSPPPVVTPTPPTVVTSTGGPNVAFNQSIAGTPSSAYTTQGTYNVGANLGATGTEGVAASQATPSAFSERMSQLKRGFDASTKDFAGLKGLYKAMPTGSVAAGLGSTYMGYMDAQREKAEEEMRRRAGSSNALIRPYEFNYGATDVASEPYTGSAERTYFQPKFTALKPYAAPGPEYAAEGGLMGYAVGGPVEQMAAMNSVGMNTGYPMANINTPVYSNPMMQRPEAMNVIAPSADAGVSSYSGEPRFARGGATVEPQAGAGYQYNYNPNTMQFTQLRAPTPAAPPSRAFGLSGVPLSKISQTKAKQDAVKKAEVEVSGGIAAPVTQPTSPAKPLIPNIDIPAYQTPEQQLGLGGFYDYMNQQLGGYAGYAAGGGVSTLGGYSDGGRLLKGPGDGVSDSIPAVIGQRQPARLADGEFVVPARIVSEIGNGSTEAGARKLYAMMDRVQKARRKTVGKKQVAKDTQAEKLLPA